MNKETLEQFPYFTGKMLKAFLGKNHASTTLTRWKNKLHIIEKGKYTVQTNPLTYATTIITPSYCSFRSALYYYQLTNQIPLKIQVATKKRKKPVKEITFITTKYLFGYKREQIENFDLFIAEKEKLLIDCLEHPKAGVAPNELTELLKEELNKEKIIQYLKKINNLNLIKRTGYLLEKANIHTHEVFKKKIQENNNYPKLNSLLPRTKKIDKKWRIQINEEIKL